MQRGFNTVWRNTSCSIEHYILSNVLANEYYFQLFKSHIYKKQGISTVFAQFSCAHLLQQLHCVSSPLIFTSYEAFNYRFIPL